MTFIIITGVIFFFINLYEKYCDNVIFPLGAVKLYGGIYKELFAKAKNVELRCYEDSELIVFPRNKYSSTEIRKDIFGHWDWMPQAVRSYFTKKVLIIGGESAGKSTLTINLANYYNTVYLEEVGRELSELSGTDIYMLSDDFTRILLEHKAKEFRLIQQSNKVFFEDTDCLITRFLWDFLKMKI